jgi:class 3 adenylate cyclase
MSSRVQTVTVMFVDVVGSTPLRRRVGEVEADRLRRAHDQIVDNAVAEHGGIIVKHLGDGAMATFGSAAEAIDAAVTIQQRVDLSNRTHPGEALHSRLGISAGDVAVEEGDYFGLPVVEAQRLVALPTSTSV